MTTPSTWTQFRADLTTHQQQRDAARDAMEAAWGRPIGFDFHNGKNRLGRRNEPGSPCVLYRETIDANGQLHVWAKFKTFRGGGNEERFDEAAFLRDEFERWRSGNTTGRVRPKPRPRPTKPTPPAERTSTVTRDLAEWDALATGGTSGYLSRKGVAAIPCDAVRFGRGFISILITDVDGNRRGVQRIFDDGRKTFSTGLAKKGGFVRIGNLEKPKMVYVCEGLATGLSIRAALPDVPVVCALDAGNLDPVVKSLRKQFGTKSRCRIVIAADNDQWKAQNINPTTGLPVGNTGLKKSHATALKHRCRVVYPDFTGHPTHTSPTDFNDLHTIAGIDEVRRQLSSPMRPDPTFAFFDARQKSRKTVRSWFDRHRVAEIDDRFIPEILPDDEIGDVRSTVEMIHEQRVTGIRSGRGSGKTQLLTSIIDRTNGTSVYITPRVSLAGDASRRLGTELYSDMKGNVPDDAVTVNDARHLAICVNSLPMLTNDDGQTRRFDYVFIDEIEQLLKQLTSDIVADKRNVLAVFKYLLRSAEYVIVLDADLGPTAVRFLERWLPGERFLFVLNHYHVGQGREAVMYDKAAHVVRSAVAELNTGGRVWFSTNSEKQARAYFQLLERIPGKRGLCVTSPNSGDPDVQAFFEDPNAAATKYDFVVASPAISTGLSIDVDHFTWVGGTFSRLVGTPHDALQALARCRSAKTHHIYCDQARNSLPTSPTDIAAKWKDGDTADNQRSMEWINPETGRRECMDTDYESLVVDVRRTDAIMRNDYLFGMLALIDADGFTIRYADVTADQADEADFLSDIAAELGERDYIDGIVSAPDIDDADLAKLKTNRRPTMGETHTRRRGEIKRFYNLDDDTTDDDLRRIVIEDRRGRRRGEIENLEITLADDTTIEELDSDQANHFRPDRRDYHAERELRRRTLSAVGIDQKLDAADITYRATDTRIREYVEWVKANVPTVRRAYTGRVSLEYIEAHPLVFIGRVLATMGIKQIRTGRNDRGQYRIAVETVNQQREIINRRGLVGTPFHVDSPTVSPVPAVRCPQS